jgi:predicted NUDIX family NTP pyrophosphohydrolase
MSRKTSAGTLLYRTGPTGLEVLLVHPSGWYNRNKPWSIPKGKADAEETDLETTARRETLEETGFRAGELASLGHIVYHKSGKQVHCFADAQPHTASWEVDQARFVPVEEARQLLHEDQRSFVDRLVERLGKP